MNEISPAKRSEIERAEGTDAAHVVALLEAGGVHSAKLAVATGWPLSWIQTLRGRYGYDADYGRELPRFRQLDEDGRTQAVREIWLEDGLDQRAVAKHFGVSRATIRKYWPKEARHPRHDAQLRRRLQAVERLKGLSASSS